jgi:hypothetical protein
MSSVSIVRRSVCGTDAGMGGMEKGDGRTPSRWSAPINAVRDGSGQTEFHSRAAMQTRMFAGLSPTCQIPAPDGPMDNADRPW